MCGYHVFRTKISFGVLMGVFFWWWWWKVPADFDKNYWNYCGGFVEASSFC